jgi:hypothetical protein
MKDETAVHDETSSETAVAMQGARDWAKVVDLTWKICQDEHSLIQPMLSVLACGDSSLKTEFKPTADQLEVARELCDQANAIFGRLVDDELVDDELLDDELLDDELADDEPSASRLDETPCRSDAPAVWTARQSAIVKVMLFRQLIEFTLNSMATWLRETSSRERFEIILWIYVRLLQRFMNVGMMAPPSPARVKRLAPYLEPGGSGDVPELLLAVERRRALWQQAITEESGNSVAGQRARPAPRQDFSWEDLEGLMVDLCQTKPHLIESALMILGCVRPRVSELYEVGPEDLALIEKLGDLLQLDRPILDSGRPMPEAFTDSVSSSFALQVSLVMSKAHFRFAIRHLIVTHEYPGRETVLPLLEEEPVHELLTFLAAGRPGLLSAFLKTLRSGRETADLVARWTARSMATVEDR